MHFVTSWKYYSHILIIFIYAYVCFCITHSYLTFHYYLFSKSNNNIVMCEL